MFQVFGNIANPFSALGGPASLTGSQNGSGLFILMNVLIKTAIVGAGIYAFFNIIIAGYGFLSSPEPKEVAKSWARIWQAMLGLLIIAGSFVLAAIFGSIIFGDPSILLTPRLFGP